MAESSDKSKKALWILLLLGVAGGVALLLNKKTPTTPIVPLPPCPTFNPIKMNMFDTKIGEDLTSSSFVEVENTGIGFPGYDIILRVTDVSAVPVFTPLKNEKKYLVTPLSKQSLWFPDLMRLNGGVADLLVELIDNAKGNICNSATVQNHLK